MSFLNSVLSKITGDEQGDNVPTPAPYVPRPKTTARPLNATSERPLGTARVSQVPDRKRKAEDNLEKDSRPKPRPIANETKAQTTAKPALNSTLSKSSSTVPAQQTRPIAALKTPASQREPKKGSFKEIMNRAKAQKDNPKPLQIGVVQHKKIEPKSRTEKRELALSRLPGRKNKAATTAASRSASPTGKATRPSEKGRTGTSQAITTEKRAPSSAKLSRFDRSKDSYKGTARPNPQSTYTGTARPSRDKLGAAPPSSRPRSQFGSTQVKSSRHRQFSEDEDDDDEDDLEEEEDYGSDVSSDMEATGADVEEEEMFSAQLARREDEAALREEAELKRQKELKKRKWMEQSGRR